jgi:putative ABC transport system permease protein
MSIWRLIRREIAHRKLNFLLALLAVAIGAACLVGAEALLRIDRDATDAILTTKHEQVQKAIEVREADVAKSGAELEDAIRKHMLGLGFNILILPQDQDLSELHLNGTLTATMPEEYVDRLSNSSIVSIEHLLPSVMKRVHWPERDIDIVLYGTRGEVPFMHRGVKKPLLDAVAPGQIVVGHDVQARLGLKEGDQVTLMGRDFTVSKVHPQRGSTDDVTVWIDLKAAQELLSMQNLVHGILALECQCAGDRITQVREELGKVLPGTQVIERYSQALARAEARNKANAIAVAALDAEKQSGQQLLVREQNARSQLELQHRQTAGTLVPLALIGAAALVGLLAYLNARQRREEIGLLMALGVRTDQVMLLFLGKAVLVGLIGGLFGVAIGLWVSVNVGNTAGLTPTVQSLISSSTALRTTVAITPIVAVALAAMASWVAALIAARQDPAIVLQGD